MTAQGEQRSDFWRPLVVRGVPLHIAIPVASGLLGLGLMLSGGVASFIGGWLLAVGFPLAVGAFVADPRALAAPAILWAGWLVVVALTGPTSGVPQTPLIVAVALAALGTAATWLGQRAVQPAVEEPHRHEHARRALGADLDVLLAATNDPAESPSLDPSAEVDDALAELLQEPIDPVAVEDGAPSDAGQHPSPQVDTEVSEPVSPSSGAGDADADTETGHVIEFAALREEDLDPRD